MTDPDCPGARIVDITLDEGSAARWNPEIEHERRVAIFDLLEDNRFAPAGTPPGPYAVHLAIVENRLEMHIRPASEDPQSADKPGDTLIVTLALTGFRRLIKDYFTVCGNYFEAIRAAPPSRIEALDMGRRALHDEGARLLREKLENNARIDFNTARRLFTLLCVLHLRV